MEIEPCPSGFSTIHDDILVFGEGSTEDEELVDRNQNLHSQCKGLTRSKGGKTSRDKQTRIIQEPSFAD